MTTSNGKPTLSEAFTAEHHGIDAGIQAYLQAASGDARQAAVHLAGALEALRRHIYLEEQIVFPHLPQGPLMMPLMVMYREHGQLWRQTDALDGQLDRVQSGGQLADGCRQVLELLERHNAKEEPIIYPHMDADLDRSEQAEVRRLLEQGTLPAGWVPREA